MKARHHTSQRLLAGFVSLALVLAPVAPTAFAEAGATHVVEAGETLWQIATAAGTDAATLMQLNGLDDGDAIYTGQILKLPAQATRSSTGPAPAVAAAATTARHTVAAGESLWDIAQQYGTTVDAIVAANDLDNPDALTIGTVLVVPVGSAPATRVAQATLAPTAAPTAAPAPTVAPTATSASATTGGAGVGRGLFNYYTVQPGETLNAIAQQYGVDVATIAAASGIDNPDRVAVGTVLKIPVPSRQYVIQPGDTLYAIAASERVDLGLLIDFNSITNPESIQVGQVLTFPTGSSQMAAASPNGPVPPTSTPSPAPTPATTPTVTASPASTTATATPTKTATASASPTASATTSPSPTAKPSATIPPGTSSDGLVGMATRHLGLPYAFGGSGPTSFDCSGFVWYVAKQVGKPVSRGLVGQYNAGSHPARDALKPGDLVFFQNTYINGLSHVGIYVGNDAFIHAADEQSGVTLSSLTADYWSSRYFGATRLP